MSQGGPNLCRVSAVCKRSQLIAGWLFGLPAGLSVGFGGFPACGVTLGEDWPSSIAKAGNGDFAGATH